MIKVSVAPDERYKKGQNTKRHVQPEGQNSSFAVENQGWKLLHSSCNMSRVFLSKQGLWPATHVPNQAWCMRGAPSTRLYRNKEILGTLTERFRIPILSTAVKTLVTQCLVQWGKFPSNCTTVSANYTCNCSGCPILCKFQCLQF